MKSPHDEQALAAPYVLGALEPAERAAFEAHAATCPICHDEVRSLQRVADALARTVPQRTPSPALRARVLGAIAGSGRETFPDRRPRPIATSWWPLAAALVLAVGLGAYAWSLQRRLSVLEARLGDAERRASAAQQATIEARRVADRVQIAMTVLAAPDLARIDLAGQSVAPRATARALWSRQRGMVFTAANLPPVPAGRVYQVWVVTARAPVSAGLFTPDVSGGAATFFETSPDIAAPLAVAVTLEPAGGVPAPTGERYLVGAPSSPS